MLVTDPRSSSRSERISTAGKVYSLSTVGSRVVVATSNRQVLVYDLRALGTPEQTRESPLRHQTRRVACSHDGQFFAISSTEVIKYRYLFDCRDLLTYLCVRSQGRVGIEYFELNAEQQSKKYAFKCHRRGDVAYPINALAFHPVHGNIAFSNLFQLLLVMLSCVCRDICDGGMRWRG